MIVFATNNAHKLEEVRRMVGSRVEIKSMAEIGCTDDIAETATTLDGNAELKARYVSERFGCDCFDHRGFGHCGYRKRVRQQGVYQQCGLCQ